MRGSYVLGAERLIRKFVTVGVASDVAAGVSLKATGEDLKTRSQQLVPVNTGNLRDSAFYTVEKRLEGPELTVGYTAEYAGYVENDLEAYHPRGQAMYLSTPFLQQRGRSVAMLKAGMEGALRG